MTIQFANPAWFWALLGLIPILGLRLLSHFRHRNNLEGLVSPRLRNRLISGSSRIQRWVSFVFLSLSWACVVLALTRPQWGFEESETESEGRNLIIAIDTSRSMLANDLAPNRIARAKLAAQDIVHGLPEDRIGILAFAGRAFLQAPLTVDHDAIVEAIEQLDTEIIPRGGTNLSEAIKLAMATFREAKVEKSALVIFSDGEALEGRDDVAKLKREAVKNSMAIVTIGVGTKNGAIIPEYDDKGNIIPGAFVKDDQGQVVRTRLDSNSLRSLASGGGVYIHLGGNAALSMVVERITRMIETTRSEEESRRRPIERFMWPLGFAFVFMIFSYLVPLFFFRNRRKISPALAIWLLGCTFVSADLHAGDSHWEGFQAFQNGDFDRAIADYETELSHHPSGNNGARLRFGIGSAAYRKGDYERASQEFGQALANSDPGLQEKAHYNLGNTLFRKGEVVIRGSRRKAAAAGIHPNSMQAPALDEKSFQNTLRQWNGALEHYQSALALNQKNENASHNIEIVRKRIEELKKQQEQQKKEQQKQDKKDQDKDKDKEQNNSQNQQNQQNQPQKQAPDGQDQKGKPDQNQNPPNQQNKEDQKEDQSGQNNEDQQKQDRKNQPQQEQEPGNEAPKDGELKANPSDRENQQQQPANPADIKQNPETGYSPSEARRLLRALADETEVRPLLRPAKAEKYKNW